MIRRDKISEEIYAIYRDPISLGGSRWTNRRSTWLEQPITRMVSVPGPLPAASGILVQPLRAATECEVDLVRKRPDHGIGFRPWMPQQPTELYSCATASNTRLDLSHTLTRTSPCEVDRLTRSLADFAKIVDIFDAHNA